MLLSLQVCVSGRQLQTGTTRDCLTTHTHINNVAAPPVLH